MDSISLHPVVATAIGVGLSAAFGWLTKLIADRDKEIEAYKGKVAAAYAEGRKREEELEAVVAARDALIETKNKRIAATDRRLSWFEAKYGAADEPPEVNRTNIDVKDD